MVKSISVLGSTGSIGRQSLAAAARLGLRVEALTAQKSIGLLEEQIRAFSPSYAAVYDSDAAEFDKAIAAYQHRERRFGDVGKSE